MAEHDFRYTLMNPQHTLTECRAIVPGQYQVTGQGGSIQVGDTLLVSLKGSKSLSMHLQVNKVRHLINPLDNGLRWPVAQFLTSWPFILGKCSAMVAVACWSWNLQWMPV